jgi:8-hydroxy-5-deazaflavin:NADPH oxidoreductase
VTTLGIVGSGHVGTNIASAGVAAGYNVVLSNSREPDTLDGLVKQLGRHAAAAVPEDACRQADIAVVAVPLPAVESIPVEPLSGKIVLCTVNYFPERLGAVPDLDDGSTTTPGLLQRHLPESHVVRAFNMITAEEIATDGFPKGHPSRRALALAGDEPAAKKVVADLYDRFGFDTVDIGELSESWRLDPGQPAFVKRQNADELRANVTRATRPRRGSDGVRSHPP